MPTTTRPDVWRYPYSPTARQRVAHQLTCDELLYGGAAGGGKTDMLLASAVTMCLLVPGANVVVFRRTFPDLNRHIIPHLLRRIPQPTVATYNAGDHMWRFRNGSVLELAHLTRDSDVLKYQGAEYQLIAFDELTQFTFFQFDYMGSRLRAAGDVATRMAQLGLRPRMLAATNPGGPGHHWVKARWVDPAPPGRVWRPPATEDEPHPGTRVYIPARVSDNPHVDAAYTNRLRGIADPNLRRALLDGDWDILEGVRFAGWRRDVHVVEPELFPVPAGAGVVRAVGVDYGLEAPFCALWGANLADGLVVIYRELYVPGLTAREQAEAIRDAEAPGERGPGRPVPVALDPASWSRSPHQAQSRLGQLRPGEDAPVGSIAHAYRQVLGGAVHKARNERLAGAQLVDAKLKVRVDGPRLLVYSTCRHLIRTLPALPRSPRNPEDVDTTAEDHAYDALRYLLMELEGRSPQSPNPGRDRDARVGLRPATAGLTSAGF